MKHWRPNMAYLPVSEEPLVYVLGPDSLLFDFRGAYTLIDNGAAPVAMTKHVRQVTCTLNSAPTPNFAANAAHQNQNRLVPVVGSLVGSDLKKQMEQKGIPPIVVIQTPNFEPFLLYKDLAEGRLELVVLDGGLKPSLDLVQKAAEKGDLTGLNALAEKHGMIFALVWYPAKQSEKIRRVLYTGNAPTERVISALEKSAPLTVFQVPSVTSGQANAGIQLPPRARAPLSSGRASLPAAGAKPASRPSTTTTARTAAAPARTPAARASMGTARPAAAPAARPAPAKAPATTTTRVTTATRPPVKPAAPAARATPATRKPVAEPLAAKRTTGSLAAKPVPSKTAAPAKPIAKAVPIAKPAAKKEEPKPAVVSAPVVPPVAPAVETSVPVEAPVETAVKPDEETPLITIQEPIIPAEPTKAEEPKPEPVADVPTVAVADIPPVVESPEVPHELPAPSVGGLAPELVVIPATPEPPHVSHDDDHLPEVPEKIDAIPAEPEAPKRPESPDTAPTAPPVEDINKPDPSEVVVEPAPGFDEPLVPQPAGDSGLLDDLDPPMQLKRVSMDTDKADELSNMLNDLVLHATAEAAQEVTEGNLINTTDEPAPKEPTPTLAQEHLPHDPVMAAFSAVLTQAHTGISNTISNVVNEVVNGDHHNNNETNGHEEESQKVKAMQTRSSVVEAGHENRTFEESDPALDGVLASVAAQSEEEDRRRSDDGEGWNSVPSGAQAGVLMMTLVKTATKAPRLTRERYFELVTVPHNGGQCSLKSADEAKDFFSSVRSPVYILASEDLPLFVLEGWLEGKKSWQRPEAPSAIYPSTNAPSIQAFNTMHREAMEAEHLHINPSIANTKMLIQVEEGPEEFNSVKVLI